jgi:hypothetical protein
MYSQVDHWIVMDEPKSMFVEVTMQSSLSEYGENKLKGQ